MFVLSRSVHRPVVAPFARAVDRSFDDAFERFFATAARGALGTRPSAATAPRTPALDVSETDAGYTVVLEAPGVSRDQLKVSIEGRRVSIETVDAPDAATGDTAAAKPQPDTIRVLHRERGVARYARSVNLPAEVDESASQARFENGVLTLTLTKKVPTGATRIDVR